MNIGKIVIWLLIFAVIGFASWYFFMRKSEDIIPPEPSETIPAYLPEENQEEFVINLREILNLPDDTDLIVTDSSDAEQLIIAGLFDQSKEKDTTITLSSSSTKIMDLIQKSKLLKVSHYDVTIRSKTMFLKENFKVQFWQSPYFRPVFYVNSKNEFQLFGVDYSDSLNITLEDERLKIESPGKSIHAELYR
ncbi:MAG: hypothetical protein JKY33_07040 [Bacteroidia bacterium]|nr:hypothetical protein [Bacteroidia bacterium]